MSSSRDFSEHETTKKSRLSNEKALCSLRTKFREIASFIRERQRERERDERKKDRGIKRDLARETRLAHLVVTHYSRISSARFVSFFGSYFGLYNSLKWVHIKIKRGEFFFRGRDERSLFKKASSVGASFCV
jgi:hypothetical protein